MNGDKQHVMIYCTVLIPSLVAVIFWRKWLNGITAKNNAHNDKGIIIIINVLLWHSTASRLILEKKRKKKDAVNCWGADVSHAVGVTHFSRGVHWLLGIFLHLTLCDCISYPRPWTFLYLIADLSFFLCHYPFRVLRIFFFFLTERQKIQRLHVHHVAEWLIKL